MKVGVILVHGHEHPLRTSFPWTFHRASSPVCYCLLLFACGIRLHRPHPAFSASDKGGSLRLDKRDVFISRFNIYFAFWLWLDCRRGYKKPSKLCNKIGYGHWRWKHRPRDQVSWSTRYRKPINLSPVVTMHLTRLECSCACPVLPKSIQMAAPSQHFLFIFHHTHVLSHYRVNLRPVLSSLCQMKPPGASSTLSNILPSSRCISPALVQLFVKR